MSTLYEQVENVRRECRNLWAVCSQPLERMLVVLQRWLSR